MAKKINYAAMFTKRKDGRYQVKFTTDKGKRILYDKDPERLYFRMMEEKEEKTKKAPTFREIAEEWERQHREEITSRTWMNYLPHYQEIVSRHGDKQIEEVTALDVVNHLTTAKSKGYSRTIANSIRSLYRMIFDYAVAHDYAKYNPVASVKLPKGLHQGKRTAPTDQQIEIICNNINAPFGLFPFFLLCTGLRKSEALALTWDDIDFEKQEISVTKSLDYTVGANPKIKPPKTEAGNRIVPIVDILLPHLREAHDAATTAFVFPGTPSNRGGNGGGLMTLRGYEGAWNRYCEETGLEGIGAHNLRHGTATLMFELGVDVYTTQRILGHSRVEVTQGIYTELRAQQARKSVSKFNEGMTKYFSKK